MCGITGWVSFDRDLRHEAPTLRAMTASMALRGPDAEGLWMDAHVGLGHRRLAIIDLAGGVQPMTASDEGATTAVLTYSGEIYNFEEVRRDLEARSHRFRTRSDTEVVLRAYLEWGDSLAERLNGMFAFALWDVRKERLLLVRDRMGVKPLFYMELSDGLLFGSEPKAIFQNPLAKKRVGHDGLREMITLVKTPEAGIFEGVREVRPGQIVAIDRNGLSKHRYWRLGAKRHEHDLATTVMHVRTLMEDIVSRQTVSDVPICSLLSGGLDSSIVTMLANRSLAANGDGPVRSFSVDFVGAAEVDSGSDPIGRQARDAPFVRDFVAEVGTRHEEILIDSETMLDPSLLVSTCRARDLPLPVGGDMYQSLYLLFEAVRRSSTVALSGESADEVFGGYAWMFSQRCLDAETFPWLSYARGIMDARAILKPEVADELDLDAFERDSYHDALSDVPRLDGEAALEARMREFGHMQLTRFVQFLLDRKDRMSMAHGLEVRVPFCDHRLVEYAFNIPWSMKVFDGNEKSILRAAFQDALPKSIVERRKSPYPATDDAAYERKLRHQVSSIICDARDPSLGIVDATVLRKRIEAPLGDRSGQGTRIDLENASGLSVWLKDSGVEMGIGILAGP